MIPEIGHFALILALCLAITQSVFPLAGTFTNTPSWIRMARPLSAGQLVFLSIALWALIESFLSDDFSVSYVAMNGNSLLPTVYKVSAVWGAHEGSLLLWAFMLAAWSAAIAAFSDPQVAHRISEYVDRQLAIDGAYRIPGPAANRGVQVVVLDFGTDAVVIAKVNAQDGSHVVAVPDIVDGFNPGIDRHDVVGHVAELIAHCALHVLADVFCEAQVVTAGRYDHRRTRCGETIFRIASHRAWTSRSNRSNSSVFSNERAGPQRRFILRARRGPAEKP